MDTESTYITPDGVALYYRRWRAERRGRGLIVLLHGMASNLTRWSEYLEHSTLKTDWDILRLDLRGHGRSFARGKIGMPVWSRDVLGLLDALHVKRAVLVGHSLGAHLAMHMAGHHPERVRGLVMIDPVFPPALRGRMRLLRALRPLLLFIAASARCINALGLRRRSFPLRDLRALDERVRARFLTGGDAAGFVRRYSSPTADMKYLPISHYLQEVAEILAPLPLPAQVAAPMLVLLSRAVTYTDPQTTRHLLEGARDAHYATIDAYHWPLTEQPEQVREAIDGWIEQRFVAPTAPEN